MFEIYWFCKVVFCRLYTLNFILLFIRNFIADKHVYYLIYRQFDNVKPKINCFYWINAKLICFASKYRKFIWFQVETFNIFFFKFATMKRANIESTSLIKYLFEKNKCKRKTKLYCLLISFGVNLSVYFRVFAVNFWVSASEIQKQKLLHEIRSCEWDSHCCLLCSTKSEWIFP